MKSSVLAAFDMTYMPIIACLIFLTFFVLMLFWVFRPGTKSIYQEASRLPFDHGDKK